MDSKKRVVIGVSGASGSLLGLECLKCLREAGAESHLVMSRGAEITAKQELGMDFDEFASYADVVYDNRNIGASIASGTFPIDGMVVAPCSMKTLAGIACRCSHSITARRRFRTWFITWRVRRSPRLVSSARATSAGSRVTGLVPF